MAELLDSFATPQDMEDRTQGAIPADHPFIGSELSAATEAIRNYCRWHIAGVRQLTLHRVRPFAESVFLPAMKIASVESATVDGCEHRAGEVEFDPETGWTPLRGRRVRVQYTAGFDEVPADLVTLTLELASAALGSPLGIVREQAGGVSVTLQRASGALLVGAGGADVARLTPYRLGRLP